MSYQETQGLFSQMDTGPGFPYRPNGRLARMLSRPPLLCPCVRLVGCHPFSFPRGGGLAVGTCLDWGGVTDPTTCRRPTRRFPPASEPTLLTTPPRTLYTPINIYKQPFEEVRPCNPWARATSPPPRVQEVRCYVW